MNILQLKPPKCQGESNLGKQKQKLPYQEIVERQRFVDRLDNKIKILGLVPHLVEVFEVAGEFLFVPTSGDHRGVVFHDPVSAFKTIENDFTEIYYFRIFKTIQYLKEKNEECEGNFTDFLLILCSFIADYKKSRWDIRDQVPVVSGVMGDQGEGIFVRTFFQNRENEREGFLPEFQSGSDFKRYSSPWGGIRSDGEKISVEGRDLLLTLVLEEIGAYAHARSINKCSRGFIGLVNEDDKKVGSCNICCRRSCCNRCGHVVQKGGDSLERSQANVDRGKRALDYISIGGQVEWYLRFVFTFSPEVQKRVDRKDLIVVQDCFTVDELEEELKRCTRELMLKFGSFEGKKCLYKAWEKEIEYYNEAIKFEEENKEGNRSLEAVRELKAKKRDLEERMREEEIKVILTYGPKFMRRIWEYKKKIREVKESVKDKLLRVRKLNDLRSYINKLKVRRVEQTLEKREHQKEVDSLSEEIRFHLETKPAGYTRVVNKVLRPRKKKLKERIKKIQKNLGKEGTIYVSDLQRFGWEFLESYFGVQAALITPHLVGDEAAKQYRSHKHLHALVPVFENQLGFDWSKGHPWLDLKDLREKWKQAQQERFGVVIEGDVNIRYEDYIKADQEIENVAKLAFSARYDHRIETGGGMFPIGAYLTGNVEELRKLMRLTYFTRFTRGFGLWSDRNKKAFQEKEEKLGAKLILPLLQEKGLADKEEMTVDGEWLVITDKLIYKEFGRIPPGEETDQEEDISNNMVQEGLQNLPVKTEEIKKGERVLFIKYRGKVPSKEFITLQYGGKEEIQYSKRLNLWGKFVDGDLVAVFGKPGKGAEDLRSGFTQWDQEDITADLLSLKSEFVRGYVTAVDMYADIDGV